MTSQRFLTAVSLKSVKDISTGKEISLDYQAEKSKSDAGALCSKLAGMGRVNLLVGPNNSGKSRFMRAMFASSTLQFDLDEETRSGPKEVFNRIVTAASEDLVSRHIICAPVDRAWILPVPGVQAFLAGLDEEFFNHQTYKFVTQFRSELKKFLADKQGAQNVVYALSKFNRVINSSNFMRGLTSCLTTLREELAVFDDERVSDSHVYIPIIRGLRCAHLAENLKAVVAHDYFSPDGKSLLSPTREVFNGFDIFSRITHYLLSSSASRKRVSEYEYFLSRHFFGGAEVQLVPKPRRSSNEDAEGVLYLKVGEENESSELPIYSLGDGVQTLILGTFDAFFSQKPKVYFWEEPETFLHPGMQRMLMEIIATDPDISRHQWMMTTHSNHLMDLTLDFSEVSVFRFSRLEDKKFKIERMASGDHEVLRSLGVRASSVFRTNCIVWVEGITDRKYLKAFLSRHLKNQGINFLHEDIHYSFWEFGGSNITHLSFDRSDDRLERMEVEAISNHSFVVLDGDNEDKGDRSEVLRSALGDRFKLLDVKEIENTLPASIVVAAVKHRVERSKSIKNKKAVVSKVDRILFDGYHKKDLGMGGYLDGVLGIDYFAGAGSAGVGSGTIQAGKKLDFCISAVAEMEKSEDWEMSVEMGELCRDLVRFIREANGL